MRPESVQRGVAGSYRNRVLRAFSIFELNRLETLVQGFNQKGGNTLTPANRKALLHLIEVKRIAMVGQQNKNGEIGIPTQRERAQKERERRETLAIERALATRAQKRKVS